MVRAALAGELDDVETEPDPVFGLHIPVSVPGVPDEVLRPRGDLGGHGAYDEQARSWRGCSARTSRSSPTPSRPACARRAEGRLTFAGSRGAPLVRPGRPAAVPGDRVA
jgi:hypothetical protein